GINRAGDTALTYSPAGYNPVYATWEANAANNAATLSFSVGGAVALKNPVIVLHGYTGNAVPGRVRLNGTDLTNNADFFVSLIGTDLWLTLNRSLSGSNQALEIASVGGNPATATPTPTQASVNGLIIYDDARAPGWDDWSYNAPVVDFANTSPVHGG